MNSICKKLNYPIHKNKCQQQIINMLNDARLNHSAWQLIKARIRREKKNSSACIQIHPEIIITQAHVTRELSQPTNKKKFIVNKDAYSTIDMEKSTQIHMFYSSLWCWVCSYALVSRIDIAHYRHTANYSRPTTCLLPLTRIEENISANANSIFQILFKLFIFIKSIDI